MRQVRKEPLLGAHLSIAGGVSLAVDRAERLGCNALQVFVKNSNRWRGKEISEEEAQRFQDRRRQTGLRSVVGHDNVRLVTVAFGGDLQPVGDVSPVSGRHYDASGCHPAYIG